MRILGYDYDPVTGIKTTYGSEDGKFYIHTSQDVEPHLEHSKALANNPDYAKKGIKQNFQHIAHIPNVVCMKMKMEDGFDAFTAHPDDLFKFLRKHKDKYGYLLTTAGRF